MLRRLIEKNASLNQSYAAQNDRQKGFLFWQIGDGGRPMVAPTKCDCGLRVVLMNENAE